MTADGRARPRILYLLGVTRSGSTVLDAILGSHPGVLATGELYHLLRDDHGRTRVCACGQTVTHCPFWSAVLADWRRHEPHFDAGTYLRAQNDFERFRRVPQVLRQGQRPSPAFRQYGEWTESLLQAVGGQRGDKFIADSSKHPPRALALLATRRFDIVLVHIVRDPRAVAWSKVKYLRSPWGPRRLNKPFPLAVRSAMNWVEVNLFAERMGRSTGAPYLRLRYEDLADDPAVELRRLGRFVGLDLEETGRGIAEGQPLTYGHLVAGNRARFQTGRSLAKDLDWRVNSPTWLRTVVWGISGTVGRRYGYLR